MLLAFQLVLHFHHVPALQQQLEHLWRQLQDWGQLVQQWLQQVEPAVQHWAVQHLWEECLQQHHQLGPAVQQQQQQQQVEPAVEGQLWVVAVQQAAVEGQLWVAAVQQAAVEGQLWVAAVQQAAVQQAQGPSHLPWHLESPFQGVVGAAVQQGPLAWGGGLWRAPQTPSSPSGRCSRTHCRHAGTHCAKTHLCPLTLAVQPF